MIRSALIIGAVSFMYLLFANVAQMLCVPFLVIPLGFAAGALAGWFDKPQKPEKAAINGALAGLIASVGAVAGNSAGLAIRVFVIFGPNTFAQMLTNVNGVTYTSSDTTLGTVSVFCCCAFTDVAIMVATGALGGYVWHLWKQKKAAAPPSQGVS